MNADSPATVALARKKTGARRWMVAWVSPAQSTFFHFDDRQDAISLARALAIGAPTFSGEFEVHPAKVPVSLRVPSTEAIERWIALADQMLSNTLRRGGDR